MVDSSVNPVVRRGDLTASSIVTATLMGNPGGTTSVQRVAVNATADTFTIHVTANTTKNVKVAGTSSAEIRSATGGTSWKQLA